MLSSLAVALGTPDETPTRTGNRHGGLGEAPYNVYPTRDGYVAIICVTDTSGSPWPRLIGGDRLAGDERFATRSLRVENIDALDDAVVGLDEPRATRAEVIDALLARGIPAAPVRDLREVVEDPDLESAACCAKSRTRRTGRSACSARAIRYDGRSPPAPAPRPRSASTPNRCSASGAR